MIKKVLLLCAVLSAALPLFAGIGAGDMQVEVVIDRRKELATGIYDLVRARAVDHRTVFGVVLRKYPGDKNLLFNVLRYTSSGKPFVIEFKNDFAIGTTHKVRIVFKSGTAELFLNGKLMKRAKYDCEFKTGKFRSVKKIAGLDVKVLRENAAAPSNPCWLVSGKGLKLETLDDGKVKVTYTGRQPAVITWKQPLYTRKNGEHARFTGSLKFVKREYGSMIRLLINKRSMPPVMTMSGDRYQTPLTQSKPVGEYHKFDFSTAAKVGTPNFFNIEFYGNPQTVIVEKVSAVAMPMKRAGRPPVSPEKREFDPVKIERSLAAIKPVSYQLKKGAGRIDLYLDGKKMSPVIYRRGPFYPHWTRYGSFRDAGINLYYLFSFFGKLSPTHTCGVGNLWRGKNRFDFTDLGKELRVIHAINPKARVIIAQSLGTYDDWGKENPDAVFTNAKGEKAYGLETNKLVYYGKEAFVQKAANKSMEFGLVPSYYSETFKKDSVDAFAALVRYLETDPAGKIVCGIHVIGGADGQFFPIDRDKSRGEDHSKEAKAAWQEFLRKKYKNDLAALRAAWGVADATFEAPGIPGDRERGNDNSGVNSSQRGVDYVEFTSLKHLELRFAIFKSIKQHSKRRLMTGCYYPQGSSGNYHLEEYLDSPDVDFTIDIKRNTPAGSIYKRNKLYIGEVDMRVPDIMKPIGNNQFDWPTFRNVVWQTAANIIQREGGMYHLFDIGEAYYSNPETVKFFGQVRAVHDAALTGEYTVSPGIGVFIDYGTLAGYPFRSRDHLIWLTTYSTRHILEHSGVMFRTWCLVDIFDENVPLPPVVFIPLTPALDARQVALIRKRVKKSNSILVWGHHCPWRKSSEVELAGFKLKYPERYARSPLMVNGKVFGESYTVGGFNGNFIASYECPARIEVQKQDQVIGRYANDGKPGLVKRQSNGIEEYINGAPGAFSPGFFRELARRKGVPVWSESDDVVVMAENGLLSVLCETGGRKQIKIPAGFSVSKCLTGQKFTVKNSILTIDAALDFEMFYFKLDKNK